MYVCVLFWCVYLLFSPTETRSSKKRSHWTKMAIIKVVIKIVLAFALMYWAITDSQDARVLYTQNTLRHIDRFSSDFAACWRDCPRGTWDSGGPGIGRRHHSVARRLYASDVHLGCLRPRCPASGNGRLTHLHERHNPQVGHTWLIAVYYGNGRKVPSSSTRPETSTP